MTPQPLCPQSCPGKGDSRFCLHRDVPQSSVHQGKSWQLSITHPHQKKIPQEHPVCALLLRGSSSCIQPFLLSRDSRLWVARAPSSPAPVDEFLSTLCTMPSPSSLPALPLTIYGCSAQSRSHLCPSSASQHRTKCPQFLLPPHNALCHSQLQDGSSIPSESGGFPMQTFPKCTNLGGGG